MAKQPEYVKAIPLAVEPFYHSLMHEKCNEVYLKQGRHKNKGGFVSIMKNGYIKDKFCSFCGERL